MDKNYKFSMKVQQVINEPLSHANRSKSLIRTDSILMTVLAAIIILFVRK